MRLVELFLNTLTILVWSVFSFSLCWLLFSRLISLILYPVDSFLFSMHLDSVVSFSLLSYIPPRHVVLSWCFYSLICFSSAQSSAQETQSTHDMNEHKEHTQQEGQVERKTREEKRNSFSWHHQYPHDLVFCFAFFLLSVSLFPFFSAFFLSAIFFISNSDGEAEFNDDDIDGLIQSDSINGRREKTESGWCHISYAHIHSSCDTRIYE